LPKHRSIQEAIVAERENPYSIPEASIPTAPSPEPSAVGSVTEKTKAFIAKAGPWATFLGVMGFIGAGSIVLMALVFTFAAGLAGSLSDSFSFLKPLGGLIGGAIGLIYALCAILVFFPSLFLVNVGKASKKYRLRGDASDLEKFAENVKKLFKFYGVSMISVFALYFVIILVVIVVAVVASAS
jgi:hypothetical protein